MDKRTSAQALTSYPSTDLGRDTVSFLDDWFAESPVATILLDANLHVAWVNRTLEHYFGIGRNELVGKDKRKLIRDRIKHLFEDPDRFVQNVFAGYDEDTRSRSFPCHLLPDEAREERWLMHWSSPIRRGFYAGGRVEYYSDVTHSEQLRSRLAQQSNALAERAKELSCLLDICSAVETPELPFEEIAQEIVDRIPQAWQYPEKTAACLKLNGRFFLTENFQESVWKQEEAIPLCRDHGGVLEVHCLEQKPQIEARPFLTEEQHLLHAIAQQIGRLVQSKEVARALKNKETELKEAGSALRILLRQVSEEKRDAEARILKNIMVLVLPFLSTVKRGPLTLEQEASLKVAEASLRDITSPLTRRLFAQYSRLTATEVEIASLIRGGESTQQIADLLHVSPRTVESHRLSIRKKLGLRNRRSNLRAFLLSADSEYPL